MIGENKKKLLFCLPYAFLFWVFDKAAGIVCTAVVWAFVYLRGKNNKKFRPGVEYGSARWGTKRDIAPFIDNKFANNIILTQTERIMVGRNKRPKYNINKNILIIGGSGSGKTRFHVKPSAPVRAA